MADMFFNCSSLTNLDLSSFHTDNLVVASGMFSYCSSLTVLDLSSFNTHNMSPEMGDCENMFSGTNLQRVIVDMYDWTLHESDGIGLSDDKFDIND